MNNHLPLTALLVTLIALPIAFGVIQVCNAEGTPIIGYPYDTNGAEGGGDGYILHGSQFTLNGDATITSMSCKMIIGYDYSHPNGTTHYRFAIYQDNVGSVGALIAQTEEGGASTAVDRQWDNDHWMTLNFASPVSLHSGTYWLMAVYGDPNAMVHNSMTNESYKMAICEIDSLNFPASLSSVGYVDNMVVAIYASGQGVSSVAPPPIPDATHPAVSLLSVGCQSADSSTGKVEIFGNLSAYGVSIPSAALSFSYKGSGDSSWQQFATTNTMQMGAFP